mgnify:CR=1 FL=1
MRKMNEAIALEKMLNLFGSQIVSAGLEAEIPIEDIGHRFLAVVTDEEDAGELEQLLEQIHIDHVKEVKIGEVKFYFKGE